MKRCCRSNSSRNDGAVVPSDQDEKIMKTLLKEQRRALLIRILNVQCYDTTYVESPSDSGVIYNESFPDLCIKHDSSIPVSRVEEMNLHQCHGDHIVIENRALSKLAAENHAARSGQKLDKDSFSDAEFHIQNLFLSIPIERSHVSEDEQNSLCGICLDNYVEGDHIIIGSECKHMFHRDCLLSWLESNHICPFCRSPLFSQDNLDKAARELCLEVSSS